MTLTAKGVDDVDFFRNANEDGAGQDNERIGEDTGASDYFSITLPANLALGDQTFLGRAMDNEGAVSALAAEFVTVVESTEIFTLDTDNGTEVPNRREFIDFDDDRVLVQITGRPGTEATIVLSEGDGDNHQQLISVHLNNLEPQRANLQVKVKEARGTEQDGTTIDSITSNGARRVDLKGSHIIGKTINMTGFVGQIRVDSIADGSYIQIGGGPNDRLIFQATSDIGSPDGEQGVNLVFHGEVKKVEAQSWNGGQWVVDRVGTVTIRDGDFSPSVYIQQGFTSFQITGGDFLSP